MNLTDYIEAAIKVDPSGNLLLIDTNILDGLETKNLTLWKRPSSVYLHQNGDVFFDDNYWFSRIQGESERISFFNLSQGLIKKEIKSIILINYIFGNIEGGVGLKWRTIISRAKIWILLGKFLMGEGYESLRDLDGISPILLRKHFDDFFDKCPSSYRKEFTYFYFFGVFTSTTIETMNASINSFPTVVHFSRSHPVIPSNYLKKLLQIISADLDQLNEQLSHWNEINKEYCQIIEGTKFKFKEKRSNTSDFIKNLARDDSLNKRLVYVRSELLLMIEKLNMLRIHVYTHVLLFSGMRPQEVNALKNDCAYYDKKSNRYYVKSLLSKTSGGLTSLTWIVNKDTFDAIAILSSYNESYIDRAKTLLEHQSHFLIEKSIHNLEIGIANNLLFSVRPSALSVGFTKGKISVGNTGYLEKNKDKQSIFSLSIYNIPLDERDINQLNKMDCNFKLRGHDKEYQVGELYHLNPYMFRHTFAWFIVANRLGDIDDIKYQFKHLQRAMSLIYTNRGFETAEDMIGLIEKFNEQQVDMLTHSLLAQAENNTLGGEGGRLLNKSVQNRQIEVNNIDVDENGNEVVIETKTLHFKDVMQYVKFLKKNFASIRGLPHGYCTGAESCKIKNAAVPSGCVMCGNYIVGESQLPHWVAMKSDAERRLAAYEQATESEKRQYEILAQSWRDTIYAANQVIEQVNHSAISL